MKKVVRFNAVFLPLLVVIGVFVPTNKGFAQSDLITLDIQLSPQLENAQVINISSLGINKKGVGPVLLSGTLTNNTNRKLDNLFFEFSFEAGKVGTLAKVTQQAAYPFTLDPFQVVYATNNDVEDEAIPGIEESMKFEGGLTPEGDQFIESLEGVSKLPVDLYTMNLTVYQFTNADGKTVLASQTLELGSGSGGQNIVDEQSIFLKTPGDEVGSDVTITNQYPQFSWEGDAVNEYRVIVVRSRGNQSPESLIENARSSDPTNEGGDLLQFENLDQIIQGNTFQYPSSGVQAFLPNQTYYWQVTSEVPTASGSEIVNSAIWSFKVTNPGQDMTGVPMDEETVEALEYLLGEEFASLTEEGFTMQAFEYNGKSYQGMAAVQQLNRIFRMIQNGDIILDN